MESTDGAIERWNRHLTELDGLCCEATALFSALGPMVAIPAGPAVSPDEVR